jgi:hypothetical protein
MKINKVKIQEEIKNNFKERLEFVKFWAHYVKTHKDKDWSEQQNIVINSQFVK